MNYEQEAWPITQAKKVLERVGNTKIPLFETGYGPSGLPHIGTFGEVARTTWVRHAFESLTGQATKLIAFSDDMDGLRKIPENIPNSELVRPHLGKSLSAIPDPWGTHESYADHNNKKLMGFLDRFGFDYEFASSTEYYKNGIFDVGLIRMAHCHDEIVDEVRKTLQKDRRATYSPFLPIHPETGIVMQVPMVSVLPDEDILVWIDPDTGLEMQTKITGGHCKAQWKADWALRWYVLGVDYEMSGKDLIDSVKLSSKIVKILGGNPPINMTYELFLDEGGHKISKSIGNGVSIDQWLRYAPEKSLSSFMFPNPQRARKISLEGIPKAVDEYIEHAQNFALEASVNNPFWYFGDETEFPISYGMLLNVIDVIDADNSDMVWSFLNRYFPDITNETHPHMSEMIECAMNYFSDFIKPKREYKIPSPEEMKSLLDLRNVLSHMSPNSSIEDIQREVFEVGKRRNFQNLRDWFSLLYSVLLGKKEGPRFGGFVHMIGIEHAIALIDSKIS
jgi:lysyl-tRNA synthetase, class I